MTPTKPSPSSWILEMSSPIRVRAMQLYRSRVRQLERWDDATWSESWRQAREEAEEGR